MDLAGAGVAFGLSALVTVPNGGWMGWMLSLAAGTVGWWSTCETWDRWKRDTGR